VQLVFKLVLPTDVLLYSKYFKVNLDDNKDLPVTLKQGPFQVVFSSLAEWKSHTDLIKSFKRNVLLGFGLVWYKVKVLHEFLRLNINPIMRGTRGKRKRFASAWR
jgi:hypothetical protein